MAFIYQKRKVVLNFKDEKPEVYVIAPTRQQKVTFDKLLDETSASCGVSRSATKAAIEAMIDRMSLFMEFGMPVNLGDFGTFKPTFNARSQSTEEELGADNVRRKKIIFSPGKRFKHMLEGVSVTTFGVTSVGNNDDDGDDNNGGGWVDPTG